MKKITALLILMTSFILVGCQSEPETLGITEVDQITPELEEVINPGLELQLHTMVTTGILCYIQVDWLQQVL